ncbi:hypothetical protein GOP47_0002458 [Adiantum capillus-veneris]|uniref:Pectinesterase n=1 Tax=Adiantum capillus-veneris TaxID=13818 RepID=A0A9D4VAZ6_ADICA|nr:hypothetical protein GOP47_0002458 [Adiantum capillus-veneris]
MSRGSVESSSNLFGAHPNEQRTAAAVVVVPLLIFASALISSILYAGTSQFSSGTDGPAQVNYNAEERDFPAVYPDEPTDVSAVSGSLGSRPDDDVNYSCKHTAFPDVCERELSGFRIPRTARPLEVVRYAVQAAAKRVDESNQLTAKLISNHSRALSPLEAQCAHDCLALLQNAKEQLNLVSARVSSFHTLPDTPSLRYSALSDVLVWLSSSLSYQTVWSDNFQVAPGFIQHQIQNNQAHLTQVLGVDLGLVDTLSRFGNSQQSWLNDGFPTWVSTTGRRILQASSSTVTANAIVAKDGSGHYTTVSAAVNAIPSSYSGRYVIYIKKGVYKEVFDIASNQKNVTFVGNGIRKTIITGKRNVASGDYNTYRTSTVGVSGSGFYARDLTFRNTAGASGHQAVALRAGADYLVFYRCSFEGYQDTLYALSGRQFYRECQIYGTVDFIFGNAIAVFQNCALVARLPMKGQQNVYTAS